MGIGTTAVEAAADAAGVISRDGIRTESDCIGTMDIPDSSVTGIHTARAVNNFEGLSGHTLAEHPELILAFAAVKSAAARANQLTGSLDRGRAAAIRTACNGLMQGGYQADWFPVDCWQGGAGTSTNMNMNEVIANIALKRMGHEYGEYRYLDPVDDVNMSQSTNDTYPTALRIALIDRLLWLESRFDALMESLDGKAKRYDRAVKLGRTQLQDAVPMTYGQELTSWRVQLDTAVRGVRTLIAGNLSRLPIGGTAIGTGLNASEDYRRYAVDTLNRMATDGSLGLRINALATALSGGGSDADDDTVPRLRDVTGDDTVFRTVRSEDGLIALTSGTGDWVAVSGCLKSIAVSLGKMADDLRLLGSGPRAGLGEYRMPALQAGSSIMPGKVNPVGMEAVNQVVYRIIGMDAAVMGAATGAQLQLCAFEPLIAHELLTGIRLLGNGADVARRSIDGMTVITSAGREHAERSISIAAALNGSIGYAKATEIAHRAVETGRTIREEVESEGFLTHEQASTILRPISMALPDGKTGKGKPDKDDHGEQRPRH